MAGLKKGLGRGLDALLNPLVEETKPESGKGGVLEIDIYRIDTNKNQPRKTFDAEKMKELTDSVKIHGIVQPLIVTQTGDRYRIVAGERRFRAAKAAKLKTVPVIVVDYDERKLAEVSLIENIQREDLNPVEEASAIRFLMKQHDLTQEEVSERIGKSRPAVTNSLRLLTLPKQVLEAIKTGAITAGHGRAIAGVQDEEVQLKLLEETLRLGYSVRALESRIRNMDEKRQSVKERKSSVKLTAELKGFERSLRDKFKTKIALEGTEEKGRIVIEYYSKQELESVYELMLGRDS
ncbi:MAG: ParB/RepB/Spo0J family partition protein [Clostridia bacterium]|nr:ParB/RepB/Spo0J family partition protein [Clostridia bacterium]